MDQLSPFYIGLLCGMVLGPFVTVCVVGVGVWVFGVGRR